MLVIHRSVVSNLLAMVVAVAVWEDGGAWVVEEESAGKVKPI